MALKQWPDKSPTVIAEQVGCARQYVNKVQGATSCTLPARVTGKDGKGYPAGLRSCAGHFI